MHEEVEPEGMANISLVKSIHLPAVLSLVGAGGGCIAGKWLVSNQDLEPNT